jgi:hypothetical protein
MTPILRSMWCVALVSVASACEKDEPAAVAPTGPCTLESVAGRWGFVAEGDRGADPYVAGGILELRADGTLSQIGKESLDGAVAVVSPDAGSFTLDAATCTGSAVDASGAAMMSFSVVGQGEELRFISTRPGTIVTGFAKRMATGCTAESVRGRYGYAFNAIVYLDVMGFPMGASPFAGGGVVSVGDGASIELADTASIGGLIVERSYDGVAEIRDDCTGTASVTLPANAPTSQNPVNVDVYWVDDGREALLIQTDPGTFIAGSARRQDVSACSAQSLAGRYGLVAKGDAAGKPYVAGGVLELEADGGWSLAGKQSTDGEVAAAAPGSGTFTVDAATCTATASDAAGDPVMSLVAVGDDGELRFIRSDDGNVITGTAKPVAEGCTDAGVKGAYSYALNAIVYLDVMGFPMGASPFAGGGVVSVDGASGLSLVDNASIAGQIFPRSYGGTSSVAGDCTGGVQVVLPDTAPTSDNPVNVDVVWVDGGDEVLLIQKDTGTFIAGSARRQRLLE